MKTRDIARLTFEYTDGSAEAIEGDEALRWQEAVNAQASFCFVHGQRFPEIHRTTVRGPTEATIGNEQKGKAT